MKRTAAGRDESPCKRYKMSSAHQEEEEEPAEGSQAIGLLNIPLLPSLRAVEANLAILPLQGEEEGEEFSVVTGFYNLNNGKQTLTTKAYDDYEPRSTS